MLWRLSKGLYAPIAGAGILLAACATPAPNLPQEGVAYPATAYSARDATLTCNDIAREWQETAQERLKSEATIAAYRAHNQAVGYFAGVLFPPLLFAAEHNEADRERLIALQQRRDVLIGLARARNCPSLP